MNRYAAWDIASELVTPAYVKEDRTTCVLLLDRDGKERMRIATKSEFDAIEITNHIRSVVLDAMQRYEQDLGDTHDEVAVSNSSDVYAGSCTGKSENPASRS